MKKIVLVYMPMVLISFSCSNPGYYLKTTTSPKKYYAKVAVIPENFDYYWTSSFAYRALVTELMDVGFNVIERSNLQTIFDEQDMLKSGLVAEDSDKKMLSLILDKMKISEIGKMLGVDYLILVFVVPYDRRVHFGTVRFVEVKTAKVITSTTFTTQSFGEETDIIMKLVAMDILEAIKTNSTVIRNELNESNKTTKRANVDKKMKGEK
ncbi:hypothetical protein JXO52_05360 [bacterium]|nr:hypothetical protein [bacterium]